MVDGHRYPLSVGASCLISLSPQHPRRLQDGNLRAMLDLECRLTGAKQTYPWAWANVRFLTPKDIGGQRTPEPLHAPRRQSTDPRFREHTVMASPLDFWSLIPYFGLVWIAACLIQLARLNGSLQGQYF